MDIQQQSVIGTVQACILPFEFAVTMLRGVRSLNLLTSMNFHRHVVDLFEGINFVLVFAMRTKFS